MDKDKIVDRLFFFAFAILLVIFFLALTCCSKKNSPTKEYKEFTGEQLAAMGIDPSIIDLKDFGVSLIKVDSNKYVSTQAVKAIYYKAPKKVFIDINQNSGNKTKVKGNKDKSKVDSGNKVKDNKKLKFQFSWWIILVAIILGILAIAWRSVKKAKPL